MAVIILQMEFWDCVGFLRRVYKSGRWVEQETYASPLVTFNLMAIGFRVLSKKEKQH